MTAISSRLPVPWTTALPVSASGRGRARQTEPAATGGTTSSALSTEALPEVIPEVVTNGIGQPSSSRISQGAIGVSDRESGAARRSPLALEDQRRRTTGETAGPESSGNETAPARPAADDSGTEAQDRTRVAAGLAGGESGFVTQSLYQEAIGPGLYRERWRDGLAAYRRVQAGPPPAPTLRMTVG